MGLGKFFMEKKLESNIRDILSPGNSWKRRKDARPPEIIDAARAVLEKTGAKGLSMNKISKEAGVSEATLYKYFDNKNDLLNHVVNDWAEPFVEVIEKDVIEITDLYSRLLFIAIRYLEGMKSTPKIHKIFIQELRFDNYIGSQAHKVNKRYSNLLEDIIKKSIKNGEIREDLNFSVFRDQFYGGLEHIGLRKIFPGKSINIGQDASDLINILFKGISKN